MNWILKYLRSSIGRKQIMGITGVIVALWILMHMIGNIPLLFNPEGYNLYSHMLTSKKAFLYGMELVMTLVLFTHFFMAVKLTMENNAARPQKYDVNAKKGKRSFASFTMIYSGIWILVYLIIHLKTLKLGAELTTTIGGVEMRDMYKTTMNEFSSIGYTVFYVVSMFMLSLHLSHAIGSVFQTMGINHVRFNGMIKFLSVGYAAVVSTGFAVIAICAHLIGRSL